MSGRHTLGAILSLVVCLPATVSAESLGRGAGAYRAAVSTPFETPGVPFQEGPETERPGHRVDIDWRGDLEYLAAVLTRVHANPYHSVSAERFAAAVRELGDRIDGLPAAVARVELAGLVALIGDGHTRVNLLRPGGGVPAHPDSGFVPVPIDLYPFADGIHVRSTAAAHSDLVGARVLRIGTLSAAAAADRVRRFMHRDNEMTVRLGVPWLLVRPAFLMAAGASEGLESIPMEFETRDGRLVHRELRPSPDADATAVGAFDREGDVRPLWLRDNHRPYWFRALDDGRVVYVQFNAVVDGEDETLGAFAGRLRDHLDANPVERVIVDLRHNGGGNYVLALPLVDVLDAFDASRGPGSLFLLTGRATFSAAGVFAALVEQRTAAVFVGEPTGARPNTYGDLDSFTLPSSGLVVSYSRRYFQPAGPYDERPWIDPEISTDPTFEDHAAGRDPALAAVEAFRPEVPLGTRMVEAARAGSVEDALAVYREHVERLERVHYWAADDLIELGVHYWREGPLESSLPVWRRLAGDYPESAEGHENLAETYQALGDRVAAVEALLAALRVEPRNPDAIELVSELCGAEAVRTLLRIDVHTDAGRAALRRACDPEPARPTSPPACQYQEPAWHPDGERILFTSNRTGSFELYSVGADGSGLRLLASDAGAARWSPNGRRIAFVSDREGAGAIYVADSDSGLGDARRLSPTDLTASSPMWSPSGERVAFEGRSAGNTDIYVIGADGTPLVRLTEHESNDFRPTWSSDGDSIAFHTNRGGSYQIHVMSLRGGGTRPVTRGPGNAATPRWSPDGEAILFMSDRSGDEEVYRMAPDGSEVVRLTEHAGLDYAASWSPDGERIAFISVDAGAYGVWVMNRDGSGKRLVIDGCPGGD